ncbi:unnamed protein product [Urochloa decumbens]|uniref:Pirin-like protein n=1 Tax=Urochloa decumbens TaxID=240449 RepID=A0ABC9BJA9_9POAL
MSAATACMPLVVPPPPPSSPSPLHGSDGQPAAMAPAERRQHPRGMEAAETESHGSGGEERRRPEGEDDGVMSEPRAVVRTLTCERKVYVEGFAYWRSIGRTELPELDPILSFDEFEFSAPAAFLDHPHRGFENVTYMLEGGVSYHDFSGHKGTINTGDVQWLTAGRGVVHAEVPAGEGVQRGINVWINLAANDKMVEPLYQDLASHAIPTATSDDDGGGVSVKVIAGECLGACSPLRPRTPALCLDVALRPGARLRQPVPRGWSACAYVIAGEAVFDGASVGARTLVVFGGDGDGVEVRTEAAGAGARVMVVAARPHGEAVARDGPFVMNTPEEVEQAREDFRHRSNGFEMADGWTSDHAATSAAAR